MTIEELEDKCINLYWDVIDKTKYSSDIGKLSIQFAIEILEELNQTWVGDSKMIYADAVQNKVQELKQYLDEKV
jgi:hypothetical protein